jgi:16S rRNA (uracil1498-N3)-methyltransferase
MQRYFVNKKDDKIVFSNSDINHIKKVMRMKNNDIIEIVLDDVEYKATIINIENLDIKIEEQIKRTNKNKQKITIAQALLREQKWDFIIQKLTELDVYEIIPLNLERCNIKIDNKKEINKQNRWKTIAKEASEQSHRNYIPNIDKISMLNDIFEKKYDLKIFCSTNEKLNHIKNVLQNTKKYDNIIIVIGPEGGLTLKEENLMLKNDFIKVTLGDTILRTETAPIYVLSVINYENWS